MVQFYCHQPQVLICIWDRTQFQIPDCVTREMEATELFQSLKRLPVCRHRGVEVCGDRFYVWWCIYAHENLNTCVCMCVRARAEYVGAVTMY